MKDLVAKVYDEKMANGDFEKIISEELDRQVKRVFDDMFGYNGTIKKQLSEKIQSVMTTVIDKSDFGSYVEKIKLLINESAKGSSLEGYLEVARQLEKLLGKPKYNRKSLISVSELFKKYKEYATNEIKNSSYDDFSDDDEKNEDGQLFCNFVFEVDVKESKGYFGDIDLTIVFKTYNEDKDEDVDNLTIAFKLWELSSGYEIHYSYDTQKGVLHLNDFEMELITIKNASGKIEVDTHSKNSCETIYWENE